MLLYICHEGRRCCHVGEMSKVLENEIKIHFFVDKGVLGVEKREEKHQKWQKLQFLSALKKILGSMTCQNFLKLCRLGLQDLTSKLPLGQRSSPATSGFTADTIIY